MKEFRGFSGQSFGFMQQLQKNNNKPWFDRNRESWEQVKAELAAACIALQPFINKLDPLLETVPKTNRCLGRINRDIRFSNDKSPYKNHIDIIFFPQEYGRTKAPGFALGLTAEYSYIGFWLGAGEMNWRQKFVENIAAWPEIFEKCLKEQDNFRDMDLDGERYRKTMVPGLPELAGGWTQLKNFRLGAQVAPDEVLAAGALYLERARQDFLRLYPLYAFAVKDRPVEAIEEVRAKFA